MANTSGTYVYCIVKSARKPSLAKVPPGLPGAGTPRGLQGSPGTWLIGTGVLLLCLNAVRATIKVPVSGFGILLGVLALAAG